MDLKFHGLKWKKRICCMAVSVIFGLAATKTALADSNTFVQGTTVNGLGISGMTVAEADAHIKSFYSSQYELTIKEKGGKKEVIRGSEIGFAVGIPEGFLEGILNQQNSGDRALGPDANSKYRVEMANVYDTQALTDRFYSLNCISGSNIIDTADAHVSAYQQGQPFEIVKEVVGNNVDREMTMKLIQNAVSSGAPEIDLELSGCYYTPKVTSDSQQLQALCDTMNQCREMTVAYTFGELPATQENPNPQPVIETLDAAAICSWIKGAQDGKIEVDRESAAAYVASLAAKYNTIGTTRSFHTADGRDVSVSGGSYGWKINESAETDALIEVIRTGQSQSRQPVYAAAAASHTAPEWGNTYVEVDLTNQHVYMTKDGQVAWDAPCVTGNVSKGNDTPAGLYSLAYKERNRVLRGEKRADGTYEYESPVSYWMPFNGGIGLHDANWRGNFGGAIYQTSGSHGCVNLPPSKVAALFDLVYQGIPVICYH